ncbi:MAG: hypothetical protein ACLT0Y_01000 [Christensenellales bacterium]
MRSGKKTSECAKQITIYPQVLVNVPVAPEYKTNYMSNARVAEQIKALKAAYEGNGRLLIRPSGTEHLVRIMIEGADQESIAKDAKALAALMEQELA